MDMEKLEQHTGDTSEKANAAFKQIQQIESRMKEISQLKTHIIQYSKTREVYAQYKKSNWSPRFAAEHLQEIALHKAAKKAFDALGVKKLPNVSDLNAEYAKLQVSAQCSASEVLNDVCISSAQGIRSSTDAFGSAANRSGSTVRI